MGEDAPSPVELTHALDELVVQGGALSDVFQDLA